MKPSMKTRSGCAPLPARLPRIPRALTPRGFSENTWKPASSAWPICRQCSEELEAMKMASRLWSPSIASKLAYPCGTPQASCACFTRSGSRAQTAPSSAPPTLTAMFSACFMPSLPSPTIPMRTLSMTTCPAYGMRRCAARLPHDELRSEEGARGPGARSLPACRPRISSMSRSQVTRDSSSRGWWIVVSDGRMQAARSVSS